ncbi:MAG: 50S ribosomal protein L16 3-hydroxylase [Woeseiaceae bacterium]|jgi:50S ribosomal protein L16 3-hydroxylase
MSEESFLSSFWQRQPLFIERGCNTIDPALDSDEIAWLATLPDVESRLVFTDRHNGTLSYRVEHGPFTEATLSALPGEDWTLLVQDVEKHLPDFRQLLAAADFIPDWRIDDLMVSVAAPGGSVGPHKDNYDVFLCQGTGRRNWRITDEAATESDPLSHEMSLLKPYEGKQNFFAGEGDVLYLPPGTPHWGVADDLCVTWSIGMRAPNMAEIHAGYERLFPDDAGLAEGEAKSVSQRFYQDPDLEKSEAIAGLISAAAIRRIHEQALLPDTCDKEKAAIVLGSVVTDPKAWIAPECVSAEDADKWLATFSVQDKLKVHGMARLAFCEHSDGGLFFANGFWRMLSQQQCALVREVCAKRAISAKELVRAVSDPGVAELLVWIKMHGVIDLASDTAGGGRERMA